MSRFCAGGAAVSRPGECVQNGAVHGEGAFHNVKAAIERVSQRLGNTRRRFAKCHVHPEVLASDEQGELLLQVKQKVDAEPRDDIASLKRSSRRKRRCWRCWRLAWRGRSWDSSRRLA